MVVLFLLALLLAWPTFGLSLLAYVALVFGRGYLIARTRMNYADQRRAERDVLNGLKLLPSWAGNRHEMEIFAELLLKMTTRKGVSAAFVRALLADKNTFDKLLYLAGAMERLGASFNRQNVAVTDKVLDMWDRLPVDLKTRFIYQDQLDLQSAAMREATSRATSGQTGTKRSNTRLEGLGHAVAKATRAAFQVWRVVAVATVLATMVFVAFLFVTEDPTLGLVALVMAAGVAVGGTAVVWSMINGGMGEDRDFEAFFWKVVFGDLSAYAWCVLGILYLGGAGYAAWQGPSDEAAFFQNFAIGLGVAALLLIVGFPARFVAPEKHRALGHITGTALAALVVSAAYLGEFSFEQVLALSTLEL